MKLLSAFLFFLISSCNAHSQQNIYTDFVNEVKNGKQCDASVSDDSISLNGVLFIVPKGLCDFCNKVIRTDMYRTCQNESLSGGVVTYFKKQCTKAFASIIKDVYVEVEGTARGYSRWEESINLIEVKGELFQVKYKMSTDLFEKLKVAIRLKKLDADCQNEEVFPLENINYYFSGGKLFVHNPIIYPTCEIDFEEEIKLDKISFIKL